jgi:hypothetical protein
VCGFSLVIEDCHKSVRGADPKNRGLRQPAWHLAIKSFTFKNLLGLPGTRPYNIFVFYKILGIGNLSCFWGMLGDENQSISFFFNN